MSWKVEVEVPTVQKVWGAKRKRAMTPDSVRLDPVRLDLVRQGPIRLDFVLPNLGFQNLKCRYYLQQRDSRKHPTALGR